jgi:hypothetical protein
VLAGEMRIFGSEMLVERFGFAEIKTAVTFVGDGRRVLEFSFSEFPFG